MREEKQNKKQQERHVFEIHTMAGDNENKKFVSYVDVPDKKKESKEKKSVAKKPVVKKVAPKKAKQQVQEKKVENPFLTFDKTPTKQKESALTKDENVSEIPKKKAVPEAEVKIINGQKVKEKPQVPKATKIAETPEKKKGKFGVIMIILLSLFVIGFGGFVLYEKNEDFSSMIDKYIGKTSEQEDTSEIVEEDMNQEDPIMEDLSNQEELVTQMYSDEFPNYFSIDTESETSAVDIMGELEKISQNMKAENIEGPISFIVTDENNNPVSFHIFAMSAEMDIPQDVLTALEENFEIYAFNDISGGIRFGFVIDAKEVESLQTVLLENETLLPKGFNIVLNGLGTTTTDIAFDDSIYGTHPVRFDNLNEEKTYSVDYTINDKRLLIGASKNTLRAIIDYSKKEKTQVDIIETQETTAEEAPVIQIEEDNDSQEN